MLNLYQQVEKFFSKSAVVIVDIDNTIIRNGIYPIKKMVDYVNELSKENKILQIRQFWKLFKSD